MKSFLRFLEFALLPFQLRGDLKRQRVTERSRDRDEASPRPLLVNILMIHVHLSSNINVFVSINSSMSTANNASYKSFRVRRRKDEGN
jgi:hypothetical protein